MDWSKLDSCFFLLLLAPAMLQGTIPVALGEPQVPCFFIFGDSLVDNGNNNHRNTTAKVKYFPYGIDFPGGPTGRFTNGRNIADIIAELLGFKKYMPPFADIADDDDILAGVNYGSGGAGILVESGLLAGGVISLRAQLSNHEVVFSRIAELLGGETAARHHLSKCIYSVVMGNNDYIKNYLPKFYSSTTPFSPEQFAAFLIAHYSNHLLKLYDIGARKVAVLAVGQLGCLPHTLATYGSFNSSTSCIETITDIVHIFNEKLQLLVDNLNNHLPDARFLYVNSATSSYGKISVMSVPCCRVSPPGKGEGACVPGAVPCSNRDEYMFWDAFHPTEAAYLLSAKVIYDNMSPLYADPIDVW